MPVHERFAAEAWTAPQRIALVCEGRTLVYGALLARARRVAGRLIAESAAPGRIAILLPNNRVFAAVFLGAGMAGAVPAVLDPKWTEPEIAQALAVVAPSLLVTTPHLASLLSADCEVVTTSGENDEAWRAWLSEPVGAIDARVDDDAALFIGFTSGSTGGPKAYSRSQASWLASFAAAAGEFGAPEGGVLIPGPVAHSLFLFALLETLTAGATATLLANFGAREALAVLASGGIARVHGVPTMYAAITAAAEAEDIVCPAVRTVLTTGAKLSPEVRQRLAVLFPSAKVHEYYGASELSFVATAKAGEGCPVMAVGRPFRGVTVAVRRNDGEAAESGAIGRLYVRSPMLCSGYLQPRDATGFRIENGWATVGDQAWRDDDGFIYLAGREDGMLISGGVNVYPAEVEAVLSAQPEVEEAVVFGLPDAYWGEAVCAAIRWRQDLRLSRDELKLRCCRQLSSAKCPQRFYASQELPYTPSGKVALRQLQAEVQASSPLHEEIR